MSGSQGPVITGFATENDVHCQERTVDAPARTLHSIKGVLLVNVLPELARLSSCDGWARLGWCFQSPATRVFKKAQKLAKKLHKEIIRNLRKATTKKKSKIGKKQVGSITPTIPGKIIETFNKLFRCLEFVEGADELKTGIWSISAHLGNSKAIPRTIDADFIHRRVIDLFVKAAQNKKIKLEFEGVDAAIRFSTNNYLLCSAMELLLENALKYTTSGSIKVAMAIEDNQLVVSVKNSGEIGKQTGATKSSFGIGLNDVKDKIANMQGQYFEPAIEHDESGQENSRTYKFQVPITIERERRLRVSDDRSSTPEPLKKYKKVLQNAKVLYCENEWVARRAVSMQMKRFFGAQDVTLTDKDKNPIVTAGVAIKVFSSELNVIIEKIKANEDFVSPPVVVVLDRQLNADRLDKGSLEDGEYIAQQLRNLVRSSGVSEKLLMQIIILSADGVDPKEQSLDVDYYMQKPLPLKEFEQVVGRFTGVIQDNKSRSLSPAGHRSLVTPIYDLAKQFDLEQKSLEPAAVVVSGDR